MKNIYMGFCVNTYHIRDLCDVHFPKLGSLLSALDTKHRYKAPHANRPGDRPYKRRKK